MTKRILVSSYVRIFVCSFSLAACAKPAPPVARDKDPDVAALQDAVAKDTMNWQSYVKLADELRRKHRLDEAEQAAQKGFQLAPGDAAEARLEMAKVYAAADRSAAAINVVKETEKKKQAGTPVDEVKIAEVYAVLGDTVAVFRWLDRAVTNHSPNVATLHENPDFVWVHDDPRWKAVTGGAK
jgi:lipopolysaccharide biosynthesis regulator YciM